MELHLFTFTHKKGLDPKWMGGIANQPRIVLTGPPVGESRSMAREATTTQERKWGV
jgi:hypothetical protein